MNWQFGDDDPVTEPPKDNVPQPAVAPPAPGSRSRTLLFVFLIALVASWTTGFYLGRVQRTTADIEAEIQGRLDVEAWAWQQADWSLFRSLLPPRTPSWRLKSLQMLFEGAAPRDVEMTLSHYVVNAAGDQIDATVSVSVEGRQFEIERTYRLIDNRWRLVRLEEFDGDIVHP